MITKKIWDAVLEFDSNSEPLITIREKKRISHNFQREEEFPPPS